MGWKDLLQKANETLVVAWVGGRSFRTASRTFEVEGRLPDELGWHEFKVMGGVVGRAHVVQWVGSATPQPESLSFIERGYLVGDHLVPDDVRVEDNPTVVAENTSRVNLIEDGLDRFVRVSAGRHDQNGPLVYIGQEMPVGPESDVLAAFLDKKKSVNAVRGVPPALDTAFRIETRRRHEAELRRIEIERLRREAEEKRVREERRRELAERTGTAEGRRALAQVDFGEAAKAALALGDAEYLDHRKAAGRGEIVVRFRVDRRRFECTCDEKTLQIIDAGICLTAHYDDPDFEEGTRGDALFSLESLPAVIREAEALGKLVVLRH